MDDTPRLSQVTCQHCHLKCAVFSSLQNDFPTGTVRHYCITVSYIASYRAALWTMKPLTKSDHRGHRHRRCRPLPPYRHKILTSTLSDEQVSEEVVLLGTLYFSQLSAQSVTGHLPISLLSLNVISFGPAYSSTCHLSPVNNAPVIECCQPWSLPTLSRAICQLCPCHSLLSAMVLPTVAQTACQ